MGDDNIERIAKSAGREAARELLLLLGIDASTPAGIERAQRNFAFLDDLRSGTQAVKRKTIMTVVAAMITAAMAYAAIGFRGH
jgi:hypothetical protein